MTYYVIYYNIIIICSFAINIFVFLFWGCTQTKSKEHPTGLIWAQSAWCISFIPKKEKNRKRNFRKNKKFQKSGKATDLFKVQKSKTKKIKKSRFRHTRVCVREKAKNGKSWYFSCRCCGVECRNIRFEAPFELVERTKNKNGIVIGLR